MEIRGQEDTQMAKGNASGFLRDVIQGYDSVIDELKDQNPNQSGTREILQCLVGQKQFFEILAKISAQIPNFSLPTPLHDVYSRQIEAAFLLVFGIVEWRIRDGLNDWANPVLDNSKFDPKQEVDNRVKVIKQNFQAARKHRNALVHNGGRFAMETKKGTGLCEFCFKSKKRSYEILKVIPADYDYLDLLHETVRFYRWFQN